MALNDIQQLTKILENSHYILIVFEPKYDLDAIGCALAWKIFLEKQYKQVDIVSQNFGATKNLRFLTGYEEIKSEITHLQKFTIKVDVSKSKVDSLSYDIKDGWLSIHINPKQGVITKNELRTAQSSFKYDTIMTINTPDLESLGEIFTNNTDLFYRLPIINLDHNVNNEHYGLINLIDLPSASTAENSFKIMLQIKETNIDENIATALLSGIISQTRGFKATNITPDTLNTASQLMKLGADREKIIKHLYHNRSISSLKIWGQALTHLQSDRQTGLVWTTITREDFARSQANEEDLHEVIDELIINSPEAKVTLLLYEDTTQTTTNKINGLISVEDRYDAKMLALPFNPVGNKKRASFTIENKKLADVEKEVVENIKKQLH